MFTIENVESDIKSLVAKYGAVEGLKACEIKFRDAGALELYKAAKIKIAKDLMNARDHRIADKRGLPKIEEQ